jgi:hypothetical protein
LVGASVQEWVMDLSTIRILEIGDHSYFKDTHPAQTKLLWTGWRPPRELLPQDYLDCTPFVFYRAMRAVSRGEFDVIVAYAGQRSPWHPRYWLRALFGKSPLSGAARVFGVTWLRTARLRIPVAVIDMHDIPTIDTSNFFLLDLARYYFKRELPVDHWQSLCGTAHANLPTRRIRGDAHWRRRIAKLRPISMQTYRSPFTAALSDAEIFANKCADLFFAGDANMSSTVRSNGLPLLRKLAQRGVAVDIAAERLPLAEYYSRMTRARLAWSPAGLGWNCYRHYEALQCLAVPVINYPTIARHAPLENGIHAFYYAPEGDGLGDTVVEALTDRERLHRMAITGRAHIQSHHTPKAFCDRVLRLTLEKIPETDDEYSAT